MGGGRGKGGGTEWSEGGWVGGSEGARERGIGGGRGRVEGSEKKMLLSLFDRIR